MSDQNRMSHNISIEQLEKGVKIIARVVALYGEKYLPLFERMHSELLTAKQQQDKKILALKLAMEFNERL